MTDSSVQFPFGYDLQEHTTDTTSATYIYHKAKKSWIFSAAQASGGRITVSVEEPLNPIKTDIWIKETDYSMYVYNQAEVAGGAINGNWIGLTNMGLTASVAVGPEPPIYTQNGALWYNNVTGDMKVRYTYDNESVWVAVTSNGLIEFTDEAGIDVQAVLDNITTRVNALENIQYISI
jgi:hypothetical protein